LLSLVSKLSGMNGGALYFKPATQLHLSMEPLTVICAGSWAIEMRLSGVCFRSQWFGSRYGSTFLKGLTVTRS
jgi:hypothetical protein